MDPFTQQIAIVALEVAGVLGLAGIFVAWRVMAARLKLRNRELDLEERRLDDHLDSLVDENRRLRQALEAKPYDQIPR